MPVFVYGSKVLQIFMSSCPVSVWCPDGWHYVLEKWQNATQYMSILHTRNVINPLAIRRCIQEMWWLSTLPLSGKHAKLRAVMQWKLRASRTGTIGPNSAKIWACGPFPCIICNVQGISDRLVCSMTIFWKFQFLTRLWVPGPQKWGKIGPNLEKYCLLVLFLAWFINCFEFPIDRYTTWPVFESSDFWTIFWVRGP